MREGLFMSKKQTDGMEWNNLPKFLSVLLLLLGFLLPAVLSPDDLLSQNRLKGDLVVHYPVIIREEEPGRGHNGFFTENDTTFIVYHAYTRSAEGAPLLNIRPLFIDDERWPTLNSPESLFRRER